MKLIRKPSCVSAYLAIGTALACEPSERLASPQANVVLPARPGDVDTSRLIKKFRDRAAGNVFIVLTGEPSAAALAELGTAGVQAPLGRPGIVTFDSLKIATVWGYLTARDVRSVALIPYVVRIESSEDERTILPHASNPPVDAGATDIGWNLLRVRAPDMWRDFEATGQRQLSTTGWQSAGVAVLDDGGDYRLRYPAQNWQFFMAYATSPGNFTSDTTQIYLGQHGTDVGSLVAGEPNSLWGVGVAPRAAVALARYCHRLTIGALSCRGSTRRTRMAQQSSTWASETAATFRPVPCRPLSAGSQPEFRLMPRTLGSECRWWLQRATVPLRVQHLVRRLPSRIPPPILR